MQFVLLVLPDASNTKLAKDKIYCSRPLAFRLQFASRSRYGKTRLKLTHIEDLEMPNGVEDSEFLELI